MSFVLFYDGTVSVQPVTMSHIADFLLSYVPTNYWHFMDMFGVGHPEQALNALVSDLAARGVTFTKLEVVNALVQLQQCGALECDLHGPLYLVPFTVICKGCGGRLPDDNHSREVQCLDVEVWRPAVLLKATCPECGFRYGYGTFTLGGDSSDEWRRLF